MIIFENEGLMPLEAATTFGLNAKLNENPIGFFGTGLKYAIAITLRLGGTFRLFLGTTEYEFYLKEHDFRGKEFNLIRMKKRKGALSRWQYEKLSFTTELGKHWEPWMAVRELESNMRDENGMSHTYGSPYSAARQMFPREDRTTIMIECPEMEEAYEDLGQIFLPKKELLFSNDMLEIYDGPSDYIFYRGLRVTDLGEKRSLFTYNFTLGVTLTEDRTSKWHYSDRSTIMSTWLSINDLPLMERVMEADEEEDFEGCLDWDNPYTTPSPTYMGLVGSRVASGGYLPKRVRAYHTELYKDTAEETIELPLLRRQVQWLIDNIDNKEIRAICVDNL